MDPYRKALRNAKLMISAGEPSNRAERRKREKRQRAVKAALKKTQQ